MIEPVVTPLSSAALAAGADLEEGADPAGSASASRASAPAARLPKPTGTSPYGIEVTLPPFLYEEVSQVAESEDCEISDIVVSALDQFLADHWVRS